MKVLSFQELNLDLSDDESLSDLSKCLCDGLKQNFEQCKVEVVDCPDLQEEPWGLAKPGLGGKRVIADIGGPDNLHYTENNGINFDVTEIIQALSAPDGLVIGPGAGSPSEIKEGTLSELMANICPKDNILLSKYAIANNEGYQLHDYKSKKIGVLANLLLSEGERSKVLKVSCSGRKGKENFVSCMRKQLAENFQDKVVGLAGVFQIKKGNIKAHVMPDFPRNDMLSADTVENWLKFYEMKAPLTCLSVFVSRDPKDMGFRMEHTHFFSKHGDGGHYHFDTTPSEVEYEGFFVPCQKIYRVEKPTHAPDRTKFFGK